MYDNIVIYNDTVELALPVVVNGKLVKNEYGQMERKKQTVDCHVRYRLTNFYNEKGEGRTSTSQVYIPYDEVTRYIDYNVRITHLDPSKQIHEQPIQRIEYGQDVTGFTSFIKVYL